MLNTTLGVGQPYVTNVGFPATNKAQYWACVGIQYFITNISGSKKENSFGPVLPLPLDLPAAARMGKESVASYFGPDYGGFSANLCLTIQEFPWLRLRRSR